ncbi:YkgJ family cysteine cluster protein [Thalassolituus sp. LLYu03]|uniref:YkgJ family cysteine cluster protein n=1 Tax=Thalassolituus sp. LLYu03 TaxID=3421656 RepID=UPI003D29588C
MDCRLGCGACCIAPSITSPIPGMPDGKPAGVRCINLTDDFLCTIFGRADRPKVCAEFTAEHSVCGDDRQYALNTLTDLENLTGIIARVK